MFGALLIGALVRSRRQARLADGLLLALLAAAWGGAGAALRLYTLPLGRVLWAVLLLAAAGGAVWSFRQYRRG